MNKRLIIFLLTIVLLMLLVFSSVMAADTIYINSASGTYEGALSELYAIGSGGISILGKNDVVALTGSGLASVSGGTSGEDGDYDSDSGLAYTDGEVNVKSNVVKVGLRYYYSANRDSGVTEARLENAVGSGYAFGYYDSERQFVELARTELTQLSMRITEGSGVGVYATETGELIYELAYTDSKNMLGVMPLSDGEEAVTWFSGYQYYGGFEYSVLGGAKITVINVVDIEKYVMGVCGSEMSKSWPVEALKAQAVAARTYVQKSMMNTTYYSRCGFDVTNDTYCQAYSGCSKLGENIVKAVEETANQYVTYNGAFIDALYFSSDGGATEDNYNVNGNNAHPYLKGVIDPYESMTDSINSMSTWTVVFTPEELAEKLELKDVIDVKTTLSDMGNVIKIVFTSSSGETSSFTRGSCRTGLGLYSIRYTVSNDASGNFVFDGRGWGHNLGMSQFGAYSMAKYFDKNYKEILGFYYNGVGLSYGVN